MRLGRRVSAGTKKYGERVRPRHRHSCTRDDESRLDTHSITRARAKAKGENKQLRSLQRSHALNAALSIRLTAGSVVLGDSLGALAHGVLRQLRWQQQTGRRLDFASSQSLDLVDLGDKDGLGLDAVEHVLNKGGKHTHGRLAQRAALKEAAESTMDVQVPVLTAFVTVAALVIVARLGCLTRRALALALTP